MHFYNLWHTLPFSVDLYVFSSCFCYIICVCVYTVACSFVKRIMLLVGEEQYRSPLPLWWEHQTESILSPALYAHIPTSLILRAVEVEVQLSKLVPEDKTENRVRTNPEVASSPTLVEAPKAFRAEDFEKAVKHTRVEQPLPSSVQALVVETRRDHVKRRHEERDGKATDHASHQGIQPAVFRKNLRKQKNEWMNKNLYEWKFKYMVHDNFHTKPCMFKKIIIKKWKFKYMAHNFHAKPCMFKNKKLNENV